MTSTDAHDTTEVAVPRRITRERAPAVADAAYEQLFGLLERLDEGHWHAPTDCDEWDVAAMVGHMIGAARSNASMRELARQQLHGMRVARRSGRSGLDEANALQVAEHAHLDPAERLAALRDWAPRAVAGRAGLPGLLRRAPVKLEGGVGSNPAGLPRSIPMGRLYDVVYTRDVWLHSVDIEHATGVPVERDETLDAVVLADVVADWFDTHGRPVRLELTGPAGGTFVQGRGGPTLTLDAVTWARTVSGRLPGEGLLAVPALF